MAKKTYVGIDIHSKEHTAAIISGEFGHANIAWEKANFVKITNDKDSFEKLLRILYSYTRDPGDVVVAVDYAGSHYAEPLTYYLYDKGFAIYYLEPKGMKAARERFLDLENKSDKIDSISLAYMLYLRDTQGISFSISQTKIDIETKATVLNSLVLQREQFTDLAKQATNRLHQFLLAVFPEGEREYFKTLLRIIRLYPVPAAIVNSDNLKNIPRINIEKRRNIVELARSTVGVPNENYRWLIQEISNLREEFVQRRDILTSKIEQLIEEHPYGQVLLSFPGIGAVTAATLIGLIKDIARWPDKKKLKKAAGVYGREVQSGLHSKYRRGKEGNRRVKKALFHACCSCLRDDIRENDIKDYYIKQIKYGKPKMKAIYKSMGKLIEIIYHCLKENEFYKYTGVYKSNPQSSKLL